MDPKTEAERYREKTEALEAQDNFLQTKDRLENPPSAKDAQAKREADLEARAAEAIQRAKDAEDKVREADATAKQQAEEAARQAREDADKAKEDLNTLRFDILSKQLAESQEKAGRSPQQAFNEYFEVASNLAEKMGWQRPGLTTPASDNPTIALELAKIQLTMAQEDRKFQMEMDDRKRQWDMKMIELQDTRAFKQKELDLQEKKDQQIFSFPEAIGGAIAKGLLDQRAPDGGISQQPETRQTYKATVGIGEEGHIECPTCKNEGRQGYVHISANARAAECEDCHTPFIVERVEKQRLKQQLPKEPEREDEE